MWQTVCWLGTFLSTPCARRCRGLSPRKSEGAPGFPETPRFLLAISRILFPPLAQRVTIISLHSPESEWPMARAEARAASATSTRRLSTFADRADTRPPVLSCTAEGFSCPAHCCAGGGLLPRLFTLTRSLRAGRSVFCDTVCRGGLSPATPADSPRPAVWWCPDFPLAGEPQAIVGQRREVSVRTIARKCRGRV